MSNETPKNLESEIYIQPQKRMGVTIILLALLLALCVYDFMLNGFDIVFIVLLLLILRGYKYQIKNFLLPPAHIKLYSNGLDIKGLDLFLTWDEVEVHMDKGLTVLVDTDAVIYELPEAREIGAAKEIIRGTKYIGYKFFFTRAFSNISYHNFYKDVRRILMDRDTELSMKPDTAALDKKSKTRKKAPAKKKSSSKATAKPAKKKAPVKKKK